MKLFRAAKRVLKLFQNYFGDNDRVGKYFWAATGLWNNSEIVSGKFPRSEIKLSQTDSTKAKINFELILFDM